MLRELVQNAFDEPGVTKCIITLEPIPGQAMASLRVEDDAPEGFSDLAHAYTLYARNRKRPDPTRRGRFNLGEKQVLACCQEARIETTTGGVYFESDGERRKIRQRRSAGSVFEALVRMTREEIAECEAAVMSFIPPPSIRTEINGQVVPFREPTAVTEVTLTTEYEHEDGTWRRSKRKTKIRVYRVLDGETPHLYEMGIPVVELESGDKFHYDVQQRVPLNSDRDNVSPAFLRDLRAEVLNVVADELDVIDMRQDWVREATGSERIEKQAFETVLHGRFGKKVASYSIDDAESNNAATSKGYAILHGGSLSSGEWSNAKRFLSVSAASVICPTARPEFSDHGEDTRIPQSEWTAGMHNVAEFLEALGRELVGGIVVEICRSRHNRFRAWYGRRTLTLNLLVLGHHFFDDHPSNLEDVLEVAIHELGHEYSINHLDETFHNGLCNLGARAAALALKSPKIFRKKWKETSST